MKQEQHITAYRYIFHLRYWPRHCSIVSCGRRLFQQLLVNAEVQVEADRLNYIRAHQDCVVSGCMQNDNTIGPVVSEMRRDDGCAGGSVQPGHVTFVVGHCLNTI